jgi:predicted metalloprotease with PDZ domain
MLSSGTSVRKERVFLSPPNQGPGVRIIARATIAILTVNIISACLAASASLIDDAIKLYKEKEYTQARRLFERDRYSTMHSSDAAYYYALTLNSLGNTQDALRVCRAILKRYPKSAAASMSRLALVRWSVKPAAVGPDIGILGLKFAVHSGQEATIAEVFEGTPASAASIEEDDVIIRVDGKSTKSVDKEQVYRLMIGKPDTKVRFTIRRGNKTFDKLLTRMHSVDSAKTHPEIWKLYLSTM